MYRSDLKTTLTPASKTLFFIYQNSFTTTSYLKYQTKRECTLKMLILGL